MAKKEKKVRIFSALEVANICGVVNQTAINWIKNGFLKAFTTPGGQYRIYADDLREFLATRGMRVPEVLIDGDGEESERRRVLIVDDDEAVNTMICAYLRRRMPDFTIMQAFDGFEAGRMVAEHKPGIIVLDINLPGIDGHALCRSISSDPALGRPAIIAITGLEDDAVRDTILSEGADEFYRKPLDLDALCARISSLAGARGEARST